MWWKNILLLMYPMAVFGVVGGAYYARRGSWNTFDKWYLIVLVLGLWQWTRPCALAAERRTPPEGGVKPEDDDGPTARTP